MQEDYQFDASLYLKKPKRNLKKKWFAEQVPEAHTCNLATQKADTRRNKPALRQMTHKTLS
jgi:hypothetical protein